MASSEYGSQVETELTTLGINTNAEVKTFQALPRTGTNNMVTVIEALENVRNQAWVSRKRVRHDALRLFRENAL